MRIRSPNGRGNTYKANCYLTGSRPIIKAIQAGWGRSQLQQIERYVKDGVITDCQQVVDYIQDNFGIDYTADGATKLVRRLGFVYKQTVIIPAKLDPQKQVEFLTEYEQLKKKLKGCCVNRYCAF